MTDRIKTWLLGEANLVCRDATLITERLHVYPGTCSKGSEEQGKRLGECPIATGTDSLVRFYSKSIKIGKNLLISIKVNIHNNLFLVNESAVQINFQAITRKS